MFVKVIALVVLLYMASLLGLRIAGLDYTVVLTGSMSPLIQRGDLVILQPKNNSKPSIGDIVQYRKGNQNLLHRIVDIAHTKYRTKGDANPSSDPVLVNESQISAIAVGSLRGFAIPILFLKDLVQNADSQFTKSLSRSAKYQSSVWTNPIAKWKTITGGGTFTYTAPSAVASSGSGNRAIFISKNKSTDSSLYSSFKLIFKDANNSTVYFNLDACIPASSITCGWSIGLNQTNNFVIVQTYSQTGSRQSPILTQPISVDLRNQAAILITSNSTLLEMWIDGNLIFRLQNPLTIAANHGLNIPNGTYYGFSTTNSNQFKSFQTSTW